MNGDSRRSPVAGPTAAACRNTPESDSRKRRVPGFGASPNFTGWLAEHSVSLLSTTYGASKLLLIGCRDDGELSVVERSLPRCMGLAVADRTLWVATLYQVMRFEGVIGFPAFHDVLDRLQGVDRIYAPRIGYVTGDLDIHDMAVDRTGRVVFVSTLYSCLASVSETDNFRPLWKPFFISELAPEDRCHLNGLAMKDGRPAWVTAVAETNSQEGWRDHRVGGGCVIDVASGAVVARGLSMPHSPRWYRERLWLHQLGTGEFGFLDLANGRFEAVCVCPGYLRGLDFVGDFALAGISRSRDNRAFERLPVENRLAGSGREAECAILIIDLRRGVCEHSLRMDGTINELYDVAALPGVRHPSMIDFRRQDMRRVTSIGPWERALRAD